MLSEFSIEKVRQYKFFEDKELIKEYVKNLEKFSSKNYIETFFSEIESEYYKNMNLLYKSFPALVSNLEKIYKNQEIIRRKINPLNPLVSYYQDFNEEKKELIITRK